MKKLILMFAVIFTSHSCTDCDDDNGSQPQCDFSTVINAELYNDTPSEVVTINPDGLSITGDCLNITYSSSGCDGSTWNEVLYDSGAIMETESLQRNIRLSITNEELCNAIVTKESSFDISNLQVEGENSIILNITNSPETYTIVYTY